MQPMRQGTGAAGNRLKFEPLPWEFLMQEGEHTVEVWGRPQIVSLYKKSKSVWIASGVYMEMSVTVKGRSAGAAVALWRQTASYRGN